MCHNRRQRHCVITAFRRHALPRVWPNNVRARFRRSESKRSYWNCRVAIGSRRKLSSQAHNSSLKQSRCKLVNSVRRPVFGPEIVFVFGDRHEDGTRSGVYRWIYLKWYVFYAWFYFYLFIFLNRKDRKTGVKEIKLVNFNTKNV